MVSLIKVWRRKCYFSEFILEQTRGFINKKSQSHQSRFFKAHFVLKTYVVSALFSLFEFWDLFLFFILFVFSFCSLFFLLTHTWVNYMRLIWKCDLDFSGPL